MNSNDKLYGVLSYIGILWLVPLIAGATKSSEFARYHANQGLILFIFEIAVSVAAGIVSVIPLIGFILSIVIRAVYVFLFILAVMGIVSVCNGETKPLPIISQFTIIK